MEVAFVPVLCPYCGAGCKMSLRIVKGKAVGIEYLPDHPVAQGALCPKGNAALEIIHHPDRLRQPMVRGNGRWREIGWDEAMAMLAARLSEVIGRYGPDALAFLASAKVTNEENYLFQKLARLLGTNNVDHCARLCHAPSVVGLSRAFGSGVMTNPIPDLAHSRCILILGSNFAENHPIVSRWAWEARDRGAFIIVADPRRTLTAQMADLYLPLRPGTDVALLNGMMALILREGLARYDFIAARTEGFQALRASLERFAEEAATTGLDLGQIVTAARAYARAESSAIVYCMGVTQHTAGSDNVAACANLALLCGQIGRPGAGILPLRGQNNVQGACDMGALAEFLPGYILTMDRAGRHIAQLWGKEDLPAGPGLTVVEMMEAALEGGVKAMYIMGENPVVSNPAAGETVEALEGLEFLVVQDIFLTETAEMAHLVLPAACWAEKEGSYTSTERRVQWSDQAVHPPGEARSDLWVIGETGKRLGLWQEVPTPEKVLAEINQAIPAYGGITAERLRASSGGIFWPCPAPAHPGTPILYQEHFNTPDGKGRFVPVTYRPPSEQPGDAFPFWMTTGRVVTHYNSGAMTRRVPVLSRYAPTAWVTIHPWDAERLGLTDGERVRVRTARGEVDAVVQITEEVLPGLAFLPFHFLGVNTLTVKSLDREARIPAFKVAACEIVRSPQP